MCEALSIFLCGAYKSSGVGEANRHQRVKQTCKMKISTSAI